MINSAPVVVQNEDNSEGKQFLSISVYKLSPLICTYIVMINLHITELPRLSPERINKKSLPMIRLYKFIINYKYTLFMI